MGAESAMPTEITLTHLEDLRFRAVTPTATIELESSPDPAVNLEHVTPMQAVLVALGCCGAMDVVAILKKMRQDVTAYEVRVTGERATEHPKVYTSIAVRHFVTGREIVEANVHRAIQLSISRYCPVHAMLSKAVPISVSYEIRGADGVTQTGIVEPEVATPG
jgi:putative redox protein